MYYCTVYYADNYSAMFELYGWLFVGIGSDYLCLYNSNSISLYDWCDIYFIFVLSVLLLYCDRCSSLISIKANDLHNIYETILITSLGVDFVSVNFRLLQPSYSVEGYLLLICATNSTYIIDAFVSFVANKVLYSEIQISN